MICCSLLKAACRTSFLKALPLLSQHGIPWQAVWNTLQARPLAWPRGLHSMYALLAQDPILAFSLLPHAKTSLNSFSNSINSDFSFSKSLELIEMGLGSCGSNPMLISSNFSSATTYTFFSTTTSLFFTSLLSFSKLS